MRWIIRQLYVGTLCVTCFGCSNAEGDRRAEVRRQVLRGENLAEKRAQILAAQRTTDASGALMSSNTEIAGITLPRGFHPKFTFDHEWHYDGAQSLTRLERYFSARLEATVLRPNATTLVFTRAVSKDKPNMAPVIVTILELPGRRDWSRIEIRAAKPSTGQSPEQIKAEIAARRQNMD